MTIPFSIFYEMSDFTDDELKANIIDIEQEIKDPCPIRARQYGGMTDYIAMLNTKLKKYREKLGL